MDEPNLIIDGLVGTPLRLSRTDLQQIAATFQIEDVSRMGAKRPGRAVRIAPLLQMAKISPQATHLGLHGTRDDFHASIPLAPVQERGLVIYGVGDRPLATADGGPFRFYIPDHAVCHAAEIDECANVKFLDRIELTRGKGFDNRPEDDKAHARLHNKQ
jgi:DMSO/TMAO reductase YedYZ molybdopterin-dependent catalytic subunit